MLGLESDAGRGVVLKKFPISKYRSDLGKMQCIHTCFLSCAGRTTQLGFPCFACLWETKACLCVCKETIPIQCLRSASCFSQIQPSVDYHKSELLSRCHVLSLESKWSVRCAVPCIAQGSCSCGVCCRFVLPWFREMCPFLEAGIRVSLPFVGFLHDPGGPSLSYHPHMLQPRRWGRAGASEPLGEMTGVAQESGTCSWGPLTAVTQGHSLCNPHCPLNATFFPISTAAEWCLLRAFPARDVLGGVQFFQAASA